LQPSWVFSHVPFYQGKTITVIIVIRRKDLLLFLCIPPPNVSGANAVTYPDKRFSAGSDCFRDIVTSPAWLGLPALDGGAEALVRGSTTPVEMMVLGRPL